MGDLSFWAGGSIAVVSALLAVTRRNAVASVLWLVAAFIGMSVLFGGMGATFIAVIQLLVYAGAIMVLFLFVIMLLRLSPEGLQRGDQPPRWALGVLAAGAVVALLGAVAASSDAWTRGGTRAAIEGRSGGSIVSGQVAPLAQQLFARHLVPFEVTSVLLLAAVVGAVALTKRKV